MGWAEEVLADLPVGWWPCNEGTGTPQANNSCITIINTNRISFFNFFCI